MLLIEIAVVFSYMFKTYVQELELVWTITFGVIFSILIIIGKKTQGKRNCSGLQYCPSAKVYRRAIVITFHLTRNDV